MVYKYFTSEFPTTSGHYKMKLVPLLLAWFQLLQMLCIEIMSLIIIIKKIQWHISLLAVELTCCMQITLQNNVHVLAIPSGKTVETAWGGISDYISDYLLSISKSILMPLHHSLEPLLYVIIKVCLLNDGTFSLVFCTTSFDFFFWNRRPWERASERKPLWMNHLQTILHFSVQTAQDNTHFFICPIVIISTCIDTVTQCILTFLPDKTFIQKGGGFSKFTHTSICVYWCWCVSYHFKSIFLRGVLLKSKYGEISMRIVQC